MQEANLRPPCDHPTAAFAAAQHPVYQKPESVQSTDLLKGQKSVCIEHNGSVYRLQTTKMGKLILTK